MQIFISKIAKLQILCFGLVVCQSAASISDEQRSSTIEKFNLSYPRVFDPQVDSLSSLVSHILKKYFNDDCFLVFSNSCANQLQRSLFDSDISNSVVTVKGLEDNDDDDCLLKAMELGCLGHIIQTKDPQAQLSRVVRNYVKVSQRPRRRFLVLPTLCGEKETDYLSAVFDSPSLKHVDNLLVVIPTVGNDLELYTHEFGGSGDRFRELVLLDVYSAETESFRNGVDLFPDKIVDLKGRTFTVSVLEYPPYIATDSETGELFGTEWNVVVEFCKRHNCTLESLIDNVFLFGEIFDNATGNGVLGNVVEDKADVGFGSIDLWYHEWLFLDLGPAFVRTAVTCLVPPPRPLAGWITPILPFDGILWCAVIASVVFDAIAVYSVFAVADWISRTGNQSFMTPVTACLTAVGLTVEQSLSSDVEGTSRRIFVLALLLVSLLISTSYGSGLSSVLTVPRFEKPINTAEELEASGMKWSAPHEAWVFSLYGSNESWLLNLIDNFIVMSPNLTTVKAYEGEMGFCVERLPGGNYAIQDYLPVKAVENLHLMSGNIYWTYTVSMLRKSSPFTERYTLLELQLLASGIPAYWETVCVMLSLDTTTQYAVQDEVFGSQPVKLNIEQIQGAFLFLCFGVAVSAVVFVWEVYGFRNKCRTIPRFVMNSER